MKDFFCKIFKKMGDELFTIPNMLSIFRLLLIPAIVYLYCFKQDNLWTVILIAFSSFTDIVDGFIARRFNMITDFGKFLDPLADKATQITVIACLITKFKLMIIPCVVLAVKEIGSLILRVVVYKETEVVEGAHWHGKASTCIVVAMIASHLLWPDMASVISITIITVCTAFMLFSGTLYTIEAFKIMRTNEK